MDRGRLERQLNESEKILGRSSGVWILKSWYFDISEFYSLRILEYYYYSAIFVPCYLGILVVWYLTRLNGDYILKTLHDREGRYFPGEIVRAFMSVSIEKCFPTEKWERLIEERARFPLGYQRFSKGCHDTYFLLLSTISLTLSENQSNSLFLSVMKMLKRILSLNVYQVRFNFNYAIAMVFFANIYFHVSHHFVSFVVCTGIKEFNEIPVNVLLKTSETKLWNVAIKNRFRKVDEAVSNEICMNSIVQMLFFKTVRDAKKLFNVYLSLWDFAGTVSRFTVGIQTLQIFAV